MKINDLEENFNILKLRLIVLINKSTEHKKATSREIAFILGNYVNAGKE